MSYLLDTHSFLWALLDQKKLPPAIRKILEDIHTPVSVSTVTFWEISLKYALGKLEMNGIQPQELPGLAAQTGFQLIPLSPLVCSSYHQLTDTWHRDPFDRMLIWLAIQQNFTLISKDRSIHRYQSAGLTVLWK